MGFSPPCNVISQGVVLTRGKQQADGERYLSMSESDESTRNLQQFPTSMVNRK